MDTGSREGSFPRNLCIELKEDSSASDSYEAALTRARREAAAAIGIISAVGAFGGFLVPRTYGWSSSAYGSIVPALWASVALYVLLLAVTWAAYLRPGARMADAGV